MTENKPQIEDIHRTQSKKNNEKCTPRHIILKFQKTKDKEEILKETRGKNHCI